MCRPKTLSAGRSLASASSLVTSSMIRPTTVTTAAEKEPIEFETTVQTKFRRPPEKE